jgi:hypothetical protein
MLKVNRKILGLIGVIILSATLIIPAIQIVPVPARAEVSVLYSGNSTDVRPLGSLPEGSWFIESNTSNIYEYRDSSWVYRYNLVGQGSASWGAITGTLSAQTDLIGALNVKESTANKGVASGYAPLDTNSKVPTVNLGGSGASGSNYLRGDQTWAAPSGSTPTQYNQSIAQQGAGFASDTYLIGSNITIPSGSIKIGSRYHMVFNATKTTAGTARPNLYLRFGTSGGTSDTALCTFLFTAQTGVTDNGTFEIWSTFRAVGSGTSAIIQGVAQRRHGASITGFGTAVSEAVAVTSGGFDSTVANSMIGVSVNGGTSAAWTVQLVQAELENLR